MQIFSVNAPVLRLYPICKFSTSPFLPYKANLGDSCTQRLNQADNSELRQGSMEHILFTVILQLTFIIASARIFAALFKKLGQPGVCGEMCAGLILGPSLFGKLFPDTFHRIFDPS